MQVASTVSLTLTSVLISPFVGRMLGDGRGSVLGPQTRDLDDRSFRVGFWRPSLAGVSDLYDRLGLSYAGSRRPDPRIARLVHAAMGDARSIVNVGAGTGSYEPGGRQLVAVEPSAAMRARRPASAAPCVAASAEALPFDDASVDLVMGVYTDFHWSDRARGVAEMVRVARDSVVLLTVDSVAAENYWLIRDYFPSGAELFAPLSQLLALLPDDAEVWPVPIPEDCRDGFVQAFWKRPHDLLDPTARSSMAMFARLDDEEVEIGLGQLASDLRDGSWQHRNHELLHESEADLGHRLVRWRRRHL